MRQLTVLSSNWHGYGSICVPENCWVCTTPKDAKKYSVQNRKILTRTDLLLAHERYSNV